MFVLLGLGCTPETDLSPPKNETGVPPVATGVSTADTGPPPDPCEVPSVDIGTGLSEYLPLNPGDAVTVVFGPQGGWHIDVGGRVMATEQVVSVQLALEWQAQTLTGALPAQTLALVPEKPCGWTFFGLRAIFDDDELTDDPVAFVCGLDGQTADLSVTVNDAAQGVKLTDRVSVTLQRDPKQICP